MSNISARAGRVVALAAACGVAAAPAAAQTGPSPQNAGAWIGRSDYPSEALAQQREGSVGFALLIGRDGLVTECRVARSSGDRVLDATTCRLIAERARFLPARDAKGRKVRGSYANTVVWRIDPADSALPAPAG